MTIVLTEYKYNVVLKTNCLEIFIFQKLTYIVCISFHNVKVKL